MAAAVVLQVVRWDSHGAALSWCVLIPNNRARRRRLARTGGVFRAPVRHLRRRAVLRPLGLWIRQRTRTSGGQTTLSGGGDRTVGFYCLSRGVVVPSAVPRPLACVAGRLCCPVCSQPLAPAAGTLTCSRGHSFDVAREGYVTLAPGRPPLLRLVANAVARREAATGMCAILPIATPRRHKSPLAEGDGPPRLGLGRRGE